jgi:hypothetical protein
MKKFDIKAIYSNEIIINKQENINLTHDFFIKIELNKLIIKDITFNITSCE